MICPKCKWELHPWLLGHKSGIGDRLFRMLSWVVLAVVLLGGSAFAGEDRRPDELVPIIVPDGGTVKQEGERLDIYDAKSNRTGYGIQRGDGSTDIYNMDGSRKATIQRGVGGDVRVTVPKRGKR